MYTEMYYEFPISENAGAHSSKRLIYVRASHSTVHRICKDSHEHH